MAPKLEIMPARLCDVWAFERMRPADAAECMAIGGCSPVEAIIESWSQSKEAWTAKINGEVAAMYGVVPHPLGEALTPAAVAWLLTTTVVDRYPVTFVRASKKIVRLLSERYGLLMNYTDARYGRALDWASRIGFKVHAAMAVGRGGEFFHLITYGG